MPVLKKIKAVNLACHLLTVYRSITRDHIFSMFMKIVHHLALGNYNPYNILAECSELNFRLMKNSYAKNPWKEHLINLILDDDNPFTLCAAKGVEISPGIREAVIHDLELLQTLFQFDLSHIVHIISMDLHEKITMPCWTEPEAKQRNIDQYSREICDAFYHATNWRDLFSVLKQYHQCTGAGIFRRYKAFLWDKKSKALKGIMNPDPTRLSDLIGYHSQKQTILQNTEQFLAGLPANNLLLYGEKGTGKSSMIKALIHEYGDRKLRLIEMFKDRKSVV